jgi:hypothetical protein
MVPFTTSIGVASASEAALLIFTVFFEVKGGEGYVFQPQ